MPDQNIDNTSEEMPGTDDEVVVILDDDEEGDSNGVEQNGSTVTENDSDLEILDKSDDSSKDEVQNFNEVWVEEESTEPIRQRPCPASKKRKFEGNNNGNIKEFQ